MFEHLTLKEDNLKNWQVFALIVLAYAFSIGMRFIYVNMMGDAPDMMYNGVMMINNNDGFQIMEAVRDLLSGHTTPGSRSQIDAPVSNTVYIVAKLFSFVKPEMVFLYFPAFASSLIVVPMILAARAFNLTFLGFMAALIATIAHSYYNRTMIGYLAHDPISLIFPMVMFCLLIWTLKQKRSYELFALALVIITGKWLYGNLYVVFLPTAAMLVVYTFIFDRQNRFNYLTAAVMLLAIANIPLPAWSRITLLAVITAAIHFKAEQAQKYIWYVLGAAALLVAFYGGVDIFIGQYKTYVAREVVHADEAIKYYSVAQTVREAGHIDFDMFAIRISSHQIPFIFSVIGVVMLMSRYRQFLLLLPALGLGFIAYKAGLRFTVYSVPAAAFGLAFLIYLISQNISNMVIRVCISLILLAGALYPSYKHIKEYRVPTVFSTNEVVALDKLQKISKREDYGYTWWDYGYPIRYYSNVKNISDGGRHGTDSGFIDSSILAATSPVFAANMLRTSVEYFEKGVSKQIPECENDTLQCLQSRTIYGKISNPNQFLDLISKDDYKLPAKTRDVFLILPYRMMEIFPTVRLFSNIDLTTGQPIDQSFFYFTQQFQEQGGVINLGNGIVLDKQKGAVQINGQLAPLKAFYRVGYSGDGKLIKEAQNINPNGPLHLIFLQSYNAFILADERMFNTLFIQMFVFENFDPKYFEPAVMTPLMKIYKLKV